MHLEVTDAKEVAKGDGKKTKAQCYEEMRKAAQAEFDKGCDRPAVTLKVDFINCADTEEYRQYGFLQNIFLGDTVRILVKKLGICVSMRMTQYSYDCMTRKYTSMTLGTVEEALAGNMISSAQIPSGSISGSKLAGNSVGAYQLKAASVVASKIEASAITTEKLAAEVVTAEKLAAGSVTAGKIAAGAVTAEKIDTGAITAEKIAAGTITGSNIAAGTITAINIAGRTITADQLVANLITADCGLIAMGAIQTAQIADGSITAAKIVSLNADVITAGTIKAERLLIAGEDGLIYQINATSSGLTKSELSKDQYKQKINGTVIVAQSITAAQIAAATITGNEIAANAIKAGNIDVANLFADEVFTAKLYTSAIYGGKSLKVWVDELSDADIHDGATPPETTGTGKKWLDRGVAPSQLRRWKGLTTTPLGNAMTTAREVEETAGGTSVSLDNSGEQINSALAVSVRGKNLLDIYALCNGISYVQGGTIGKWPENGGFDLTATANDCYTEPWNGANYNIPVKPNTTYTLSWDIYIAPNTGTSTVMYFIDHRFETGYYGQAAYDTHTLTFTTPSDAQTVSFRFGVQNEGESVGYTNLQLEEGDARTAFSAYKAAATVTHNGTAYTLPLSNGADHDAAIEIEPLSGTNTISTAADAMEVVYTCSGWETIGDMSALQKTVDAQTLQAVALENAMNETSRLAEETAANFKRVIEIQSGADGGLVVGDNLSNCSIKIKSASIELRVGNTAVATYAQDYVRLQDMQIRVPAGVGGLVLSKFDKE